MGGRATIGRLILVAAVALGAAAYARGEPPIKAKDGCRANPAIIGTCFEVRGYAFASDGTPSLRIYGEGRERILGVLPSENEVAPACLRNRVTFEQQVAGRFVVCPFSSEKAGSMQMVCVEDVTDALVRPSEKAVRKISEHRIEDCHLARRSRTRPPAEYALLASRQDLHGPHDGTLDANATSEARAFRALLDHPQARRWFQSLTTEIPPGAQLYGLCGLLLVRPAEYERTVPRYKSFEQDIGLFESDDIVTMPIRDLFTKRNPSGSFARFCDALAGR